MAHQCYGFVEFSTEEEAREALLAVRAGAATIAGRPVRADWAQVGGAAVLCSSWWEPRPRCALRRV